MQAAGSSETSVSHKWCHTVLWTITHTLLCFYHVPPKHRRRKGTATASYSDGFRFKSRSTDPLPWVTWVTSPTFIRTFSAVTSIQKQTLPFGWHLLPSSGDVFRSSLKPSGRCWDSTSYHTTTTSFYLLTSPSILIIPPFDALQCQLLAASLNKPNLSRGSCSEVSSRLALKLNLRALLWRPE